MNFKILNFDTELFGFKVAKILSSTLCNQELSIILDNLSKNKVRLVYWQTDIESKISNEAAIKQGGCFVNQQVTYMLDLKNLQQQPEISKQIEQYKLKIPNKKLKQLAALAGNYSHFKIDTNFPFKLFIKLYNKWIENSVSLKLATNTLIYIAQREIAGFITINCKNGEIGLLAVDPNFRNQQIGTKLIYAAQNFFLQAKLKTSKVITQAENIPACILYEKCGFKTIQKTNYYHFWI